MQGLLLLALILPLLTWAADCPAGTYYSATYSACRCENSTRLLVNDVCQPCPAGYSCNGMLIATACPAGQISPAGVGSCFACDAGYVANATQSECLIDCGAGLVWNPLTETCVASTCPTGTTLINGTCVCNNTTQLYVPSAQICTSCPCGFSCDGTEIPAPCGAGQFSLYGTGSCSACPAGELPTPSRCGCTGTPSCGANATLIDGQCVCNNQLQRYNPDTQTCTACPCGYSCNGTSVCTACLNGTYAAAGAGLCSSCPSGQEPAVDQCSCVPINTCGTGATLVNGACVCTNPAYYYNTTTNACVICTAGFSCNGTSTLTPCVAGTYASAGATSCAACPAGTISAAQAVICTFCPDGELANSTHTACYEGCGDGATLVNGLCICPSPADYYNNTTNDCLPCPAGACCSGSCYIKACAPGYCSGYGVGVCSPCVGNSIAPIYGSPKCATCTSGTANTGNTECDNIPIGGCNPYQVRNSVGACICGPTSWLSPIHGCTACPQLTAGADCTCNGTSEVTCTPNVPPACSDASCM